MPAKKHKPEEVVGKLREVEIVLGQGGTTAEACRRIAVSEQTYYRWRKEYGGLRRAALLSEHGHDDLLGLGFREAALAQERLAVRVFARHDCLSGCADGLDAQCSRLDGARRRAL